MNTATATPTINESDFEIYPESVRLTDEQMKKMKKIQEAFDLDNIIAKAHEIAKRHGIESQVEEEMAEILQDKDRLPPDAIPYDEWAYALALFFIMNDLFGHSYKGDLEKMHAAGWVNQDEADYYEIVFQQNDFNMM